MSTVYAVACVGGWLAGLRGGERGREERVDPEVDQINQSMNE